MDEAVKKEILQTLKGEGLDLAEELAANAVMGAFKLIKALLPKVNPVVAIVVGPMLDTLAPLILEAIDKIDGEDDAQY